MARKEETIPKRCHDHEVVMTKLEAMQVSILRWCKTNTALYLVTIGIIAWGGCSALKDIEIPQPNPPVVIVPEPPVDEPVESVGQVTIQDGEWYRE